MKGTLLCISFVIFASSLVAQNDDLCIRSTEGTDFWFGFMESRNYHNQHYVEITVSARETTDFEIFTGSDETPFNGIYTIDANSSMQIQIPWELVEATGSETIQDKGIRLTSEKPVNVYALNWDNNSSDVAVIYPVSSLGNEYFAMCYDPHIHEIESPRGGSDYGNGRNSEFLIVAAFDFTTVIIVPSKRTDKYVNAGDTIEIILNKGEVFQVQSMNRDDLPEQGDLTGSYILSDKPIAFYSGSLSTTVPAYDGVSAWDHLYEQIPPVFTWGREYYIVPLKSRKQDRYRILAALDNTKVHVEGIGTFMLDRGEFREIIANYDQPKKIFAEEPVLVAQYSQSRSVDNDFTGGDGDPFMIILSSVEQSKNDVTFVAYDSDQIVKYYINIITKTEETGNTFLNGTGIQDQFTPFSNSNYSWAQVSLSPGTYRLHNSNPYGGFLAYVYGFGGVESYGYGVGYNLNVVLDLGKSINFDGDTLLLCYGDSRTLDAGPYFETYKWSTGDTTQTLKTTSGGMYHVKATTADGCEMEDSIYIFVSHPVVELEPGYAEGCEPYSVELDAGEDFEGYLWRNDEGDTLSTAQKFTVEESGNFSIKIFDKYGCTASDTMEMKVFPVPDVEIKGPEKVCGGKSVQLSVDITGAPESVWKYDENYEWTTNKSSALTFPESSQDRARIDVTEWGTYEIYYNLLTIDGCETKDTFYITFHPQPVSDFIFEDDEECEGYSNKLIFTGSATDSAVFFWDLDGCSFLDSLGWQNYLISVGAFLNEPPYISLYIDDNGCISDTTIKPLGAKPNFTMEANPKRGCDELTVDFTGKLLIDDKVDFLWEFDDGEKTGVQNPSKYYSKPGFYDVSLTVINPVTQCQNSFTIDSMIKVFPTPTASISADPGFCYSDSVLIYYPDNIDSSFCFWSFEGIHQTGSGNDSITVIIDDPLGTVSLEVEEFGCYSEPVSIQMKRQPHFDFDSDNIEGCQPFTTELTAIPADEYLSFYWINDSIPPTAGISNIIVLPDSGMIDVGLIAQSSETGCVDTLIKTDWIWVHPKPLAQFEVDYPIALIEHARISFTNRSEYADFYSWDFGDGNYSNSTDAFHTYTELGEFTSMLEVVSIYGCKDTTEQLITILPFSVFTPNAFRPDSPIEENRIFRPVGIGADPTKFNLKIFSRYGDLIFETDSPEASWNGNTPKGDPAPMGNYVWIAQYTDIQGYFHEQKGYVLLIR